MQHVGEYFVEILRKCPWVAFTKRDLPRGVVLVVGSLASGPDYFIGPSWVDRLYPLLCFWNIEKVKLFIFIIFVHKLCRILEKVKLLF